MLNGVFVSRPHLACSLRACRCLPSCLSTLHPVSVCRCLSPSTLSVCVAVSPPSTLSVCAAVSHPPPCQCVSLSLHPPPCQCVSLSLTLHPVSVCRCLSPSTLSLSRCLPSCLSSVPSGRQKMMALFVS